MRFYRFKEVLFGVFVFQTISLADEFYNASSLQGMSGVINTPTAEVLDEGMVEFEYANQVDFGTPHSKYDADQYFVNFGLLPNLEVIGRLTNISYKNPPTAQKKRYNWYIRDLSASFKYQIPFYRDYLPKVAIGIQDIGGQASHYDTKYIVATKEYMFLRGSVGYGFDSINMLDGAFGSLEVKATDWMTLLGEYDSKDKQVGVRLNTPNDLFEYGDFSLLAKSNLSDTSQRFSFGVNFKASLGDDYDFLGGIDLSSNDNVAMSSGQGMEAYAQELVDFGFENVDIGTQNGSLYVAYENNILEHNELDAMGVILGFAIKYGLNYENFTLVPKRSDQKIKQITGSLSAFRAFLASATGENILNFKNTLSVSAVLDEDIELYFEGENSSQFKPRIQLSPGLTTFVGTDVGLLDYELSLRTYATINLYKGFDLDMMANTPLIHSDELDKSGAFYRARGKNEIQSVLLHRSDVFGDFINIASVGIYGDFWAGMESLTYAHENHTFSIKLDYLEERDKPSWKIDPEVRTNYLGVYSYYIPQIDTNFRLTGGEYYYGDHGYEVRMKKFVGDTAISFFYQNSDQNYVGINVALPLTPRRVADGYVQIKGKNDFNYGLRTTVQDEDGRNTIETSYLVKIGKEYNVNRKFLNRNRLNSAYLKRHALRLRDAYESYVK